MNAAVVAISLTELSALAIPGLPDSRRGLLKRAAAAGWQRRPRGGQGGGYVYEITGPIAEEVIARRAPRHTAANDVRRPVGRPKGTDYFTANPDVADAVEAIIAQQERSATVIFDLLQTKFPNPPHVRTLRRFIARLETSKPALLASFRDPDLFKGKYRVSLGRADGSLTHAHQRWELDSTPADVMLVDGRYAILGIIDVWSRRVRFMVAPSESSQAVRRLLIETITAWGVMPELIVTDQGSGFINASIATAIEALPFDHLACPPGSPEKKPFIERVFGTFTRARAELFDGYVGHNVAEAQKLRARARKLTGKAVIEATMTAADLQAALDAWVDGTYHQSRHGTIGMSPMQRWQSSPVPAAAAPPANQLLIALSAYVGASLVGKRGIQWKKGRYWSSALVPFIGRSVMLRRDEDDLGALFVFDEDGRYIDTAIDHERAGLSEREFAMAARRHQEQHMKPAREELRAKMRAFDFTKARDTLMRQEAERAGILVSLPRPTVERTSTQLDSLAPLPPTPMPSAAELARAEARFTRPPRVADTPIATKVADADTILAAALAGETVDPTELRRARAYAASTEYRAEKMLAGNFARSTGPTSAPKEKTA